MVYYCPRCKRVFKSWRAYIAHILFGIEGSGGISSRGKRVKAIKRGVKE